MYVHPCGQCLDSERFTCICRDVLVRLVRNRNTAFLSRRKFMRRNKSPNYHSMGLTPVVTLSKLGENSLFILSYFGITGSCVYNYAGWHRD